MRILIVEDEALIAMDLQEQLVEAGHTVVGMATDTQGVEEIAAGTAIDVALMDLRLARGSSGADAARFLRDRHGTPCIFLSANLDQQTKDALRPLDPVAFVSKPLDPEELAGALEMAAVELDL